MKDNDYSEADFLQEYINPKKTRAKYVLFFSILITFIVLLYFLTGIAKNRISVEELKASIEVSDINSQWIKNGKTEDNGVKKIILVPTVSFKIQNVGKVDLSYLSLVGVFRFYGTDKFLGEGNKMVFKEPLKPSALSKSIKIISDRGYRATSVNAFVDNDKEWQTVYAVIFAKLGGYKYVKIKKINISRRIKGMNLNIKISKPKDKNE